jgi:hypothetical protein
MYHKILADGFFTFAAIAILISVYSWSIEDIFLASAQWLQVAAVMLLVAIYIKINTIDDEAILAGTFGRSKKIMENNPISKKRKTIIAKKKK